jgi:hypothetical protein
MSKTNDTSRDELTGDELDAVSGCNNKGFIEVTEDELKQATGGTSKLPGMHKTPDVTFKRGTI